jgi:hypothetical protein
MQGLPKADDSAIILRQQLDDCSRALDRHAAAVRRLERAAVDHHRTATLLAPPWLVVAGSPRPALSADPNPPRLWFDLASFGAVADGASDASAAVIGRTHLDSRVVALCGVWQLTPSCWLECLLLSAERGAARGYKRRPRGRHDPGPVRHLSAAAAGTEHPSGLLRYWHGQRRASWVWRDTPRRG